MNNEENNGCNLVTSIQQSVMDNFSEYDLVNWQSQVPKMELSTFNWTSLKSIWFTGPLTT